jgi:hypothetical protein
MTFWHLKILKKLTFGVYCIGFVLADPEIVTALRIFSHILIMPV